MVDYNDLQDTHQLALNALVRDAEIRGSMVRFSGLSGHTLVDALIGVTNDVRFRREGEVVIDAGYQALRELYPVHFRGNSSSQPLTGGKPNSYKAINSMGH